MGGKGTAKTQLNLLIVRIRRIDAEHDTFSRLIRPPTAGQQSSGICVLSGRHSAEGTSRSCLHIKPIEADLAAVDPMTAFGDRVLGQRKTGGIRLRPDRLRRREEGGEPKNSDDCARAP